MKNQNEKLRKAFLELGLPAIAAEYYLDRCVSKGQMTLQQYAESLLAPWVSGVGVNGLLYVLVVDYNNWVKAMDDFLEVSKS